MRFGVDAAAAADDDDNDDDDGQVGIWKAPLPLGTAELKTQNIKGDQYLRCPKRTYKE